MISLNKNILGVEVPESIAGLGQLKPFDGKRFSGTPDEQPEIKSPDERMSKIVDELETAIRLCGLRDGMTISFHHHFRNGDYIQNLVLEVIARMGIKRLTIASSSLSDIHAPMIEHIKNGVIYRIETSGLRGELANQISHGLMEVPVLFRSHGGRAYAIASGELKIDVAFLGVPSADLFGNANGFSRDGDNSTACGSLGYAMVDAQYADKVVLLTNNIVPYPNTPCAIPQTDV
jgi:citrate lyase subunit alpha/citrate CoA-transferase